METYDFKKFPIEYSLDGKVFKGLPADGEVAADYKAGVTTLKYSAYNGDLKITAEVILYDNYAVRELRASIENIGKAASGVISDFKLLGSLPEAHPTVIYSNGDDMSINSYKWFSEKIGGGFKRRIFVRGRVPLYAAYRQNLQPERRHRLRRRVDGRI